MTMNETFPVAPLSFLIPRFSPWQMFTERCRARDDDDTDAAVTDAEDVDDFDAEDPRDLRVRDRLASLESFSAA